MGRCGLALWLWVFGLGITRGAAAFPTSRLVYARGPGAEQCPDQDAIRKAVASWLGYDPFFPGSDKTIVARILRDSAGLKGQVELVDEHGVELGLREFSAEPDKCADLVRAMALSISIAIDPKSAETYANGPPDEPLAAESSSEPEPSKPSLEGDTALHRVPPDPTPSAALETSLRSTPRGVVWTAGIGAMGWLGVAPKPTLAVLGFASARSGAWSLALEGRADLPVTDESKGFRFRTSSYALSAVPCLHFGPAFACELTSLGWLQATGTQPTAHSGTSLLFSVGARLGAELAFTPSFGLVAQADAVVDPWQVELRAQGQSLWQTPTVAGGAGLAAVVHFH